ncbi:MAG: hypothetical protein LBV52_03295 [Spirochaetaceae bacterium]|jgi:hypothetical protein|nr:hypothetical protein [Spirochaetaceae bacterium]
MRVVKFAAFLLLFNLMFLLSAAFAHPFQITVQGGIDGNSYSEEKYRPAEEIEEDENEDENEADDNGFLPLSQIFGGAKLYGELLGAFDYSIKYNIDTIWRNTLSGDVVFHFNNLNLGLGLFGGSGDFQTSTISVGVLGGLGVEFPEIFFASFNFGTTDPFFLGVGEGIRRQSLNIKAGGWLPNIYAFFEFSLINSSEFINDSQSRELYLNRYALRLELFQKNVPFRVKIMFGSQDLGRNYKDTDTEINEELKVSQILLGLGLVFTLNKYLELFAEGEFPITSGDIYSIGKFYRFWAGFTFSYPPRDY